MQRYPTKQENYKKIPYLLKKLIVSSKKSISHFLYYLWRTTVQVVLDELLYEAEAAEPGAVLGLRRQRPQQRQAVLRARQRATVATGS